jgi:hypothetical protein
MSMPSEKINRTDRAIEMVTEVGHWMVAAGLIGAVGLILARMLVSAL